MYWIFLLIFCGLALLVGLSVCGLYYRQKRMKTKSLLPTVTLKSVPRLTKVVIDNGKSSRSLNVNEISQPILEVFEHNQVQSRQSSHYNVGPPTSFRMPLAKEIVFEREIGKGKFGKVWRGTWIRGNQSIRVALREWPAHLNVNDETWKTLNHKNVVSVFGMLHESIGKSYLVMDFISSGNLWDLLLLGPPLSEKQSLQMIQVVTQGLEYLHAHDIVHGDLSPKNILLKHTPQGWEPKLSDFGMSQIFKPNDIDHLKLMAPEWYSTKIYTKETDLWALGCLFVQIYSCNELFPGKKMQDVTLLIASGQLKPHLPINSPQDLVPIVNSLLSLRPDERPPTTKLLSLLQPLNIST